MVSQQIVNGLVLGSTYALFALGFTLIFGALRVINMIYGFYFALGAYVALEATKLTGGSVASGLLAGTLAAGATAVLLDALLLLPLQRARAPELSSLMLTIGATLFLYAATAALFGTDVHRFPASVVEGTAFAFAGIYISMPQILILACTVVFVTALLLLIRQTRLGLAIRAVAENPDAAGLMGINATMVTVSVSFLGGSLAGAAGVLIGLNFNAIQPYMGEHMMLRGFAVIIVGGLGDLRGAVIAGILLGLVEVFTAAYVTSTLKDALAFSFLIATLWLRPVGLFGRVAAKRP